MDTRSVKASIIVVNYNSRNDLEACLPSVCSQSIDDYEVIVIDNDSTDDSISYVREEFPDVRLIPNAENRWYAGGNNVGLEAARGEYLVILNPDVEVDHEWLEHLLEPFDRDATVGLTTSRVVRFDDRSRLNTCGNRAHYTGLGFCRGLNEPVDTYSDKERVPAVSGCAFAIRRDMYEQIGGFDETFEMYLEEMDLSWRARLAGYDIVHVPSSIVYHKYELSVSPQKLFRLERNRYLVLCKHLTVRTLLVLLPSLLLTEVLVWMYAARYGWRGLARKGHAWQWLWANRRAIVAKRQRVQALRERSDRELLAAMDVALPLDQLGVPRRLQGMLDPLVRLAYRPWHRLATWT